VLLLLISSAVCVAFAHLFCCLCCFCSSLLLFVLLLLFSSAVCVAFAHIFCCLCCFAFAHLFCCFCCFCSSLLLFVMYIARRMCSQTFYIYIFLGGFFYFFRSNLMRPGRQVGAHLLLFSQHGLVSENDMLTTLDNRAKTRLKIFESNSF
jgi:hypothetical protein